MEQVLREIKVINFKNSRLGHQRSISRGVVIPGTLPFASGGGYENYTLETAENRANYSKFK